MHSFTGEKHYDNLNDLINASEIRISQEVASPTILISRENTRFFAQLGATLNIGDESFFCPANSLSHDWVMYDNIIRPLPNGITRLIEEKFNPYNFEELSLKDVIALEHSEQSDITIEVESTAWAPSKRIAATLTGEIKPEGLNATLYPYQAKGVSWMLDAIKINSGLILADEMGLGKTIQIICLFLKIRPSKERPALVVCPTSLIANWRNEIFKFAPKLSVLVHRGEKRAGLISDMSEAEIIITTYDTVLKDRHLLTNIDWTWLVCDEAQAIKNPNSQKRSALCSLSSKYTIAVTGTPVETSLKDLWSLSDFVVPGIFGSLDAFQSVYPDSEESASELNRYVSAILLRRVVADVANDLPERRDIDVPLVLSDESATHYESIRQIALQEYSVSGALVASTRLQLFCAHPLLLDHERHAIFWERFPANNSTLSKSLITPKLEFTISTLLTAFENNRKVLIFANYNNCGLIIAEAIKHVTNLFFGAINGETPADLRQETVDDFSNWDGPAVLVLNPKAAGAGLNITAATIVIHFTQTWNPAVEAQASARAYRRGQKSPVTIYRPFYQGTVDEIMIERSARRSAMSDEAIPVSLEDEEDMNKIFEISPLAR